MKYRTPDGRVIFVSSGIGDDKYGTFYQKNAMSIKRVVSPEMPMVESREQAQKNLDAYAKKKGFTPVAE